MTSRPGAQRLAEYLIRRACRRLPGSTRDDRYREWVAELHAILHDPGTRHRAHHTTRGLLYAADHARSTRRLAKAAGHPGRRFPPARYDQLMPAAATCPAVGTATGIAVLIWSPSHHGLATWIFTATITATSVMFWWRPRRRSPSAPATPRHPGKRLRRARSRRLLLAAMLSLSAGLAIGMVALIWLPSHHGLANAIWAASTTVGFIFWWRARRRPRHATQ